MLTYCQHIHQLKFLSSTVWSVRRTVWLVIFAKYLFLCFSWVISLSQKLKPWKFCWPCVKRINHISIPGLLLYSSLQKRVSDCAFDGYHWSNPKCYVNTGARSRQWRKAESGSNCRGSQIYRLRKLKPRTFLKPEFWPLSQKFVLTKITNHTVFMYCTRAHNHTGPPIYVFLVMISGQLF